MYKRLLSPSNKNSFFIFGARGTGKSTYLKKQFKMKNPWVLNLLDPEIEDYYAKTPKRIEQEYISLKKKPDWIVIDEIQKVPRLLDMVHLMIESKNVKFILTGSSARKLKRGSSNLLAGRAFVHEMYPLSPLELADEFNLIKFLHWGGLPKIYSLYNDFDKRKYLQSYVLTYLNEEIRLEQIIRKLDPFRSFLEVAAQCSGKIINHKKISQEIGVDIKTVQSYFHVLEDTLIGFYLPSFHESVRKSQKQNPKFYFFDTGVKKCLEGSLEQIPVLGTSVFGELFETMLILEIRKLNSYYEQSYKLSFFKTKYDVEIDLILTKNRQNILIEIKSSDSINDNEINKIGKITEDFPNVKKIFMLSRHPKKLSIGNVQCIPWLEFLRNFKKYTSFSKNL
ncbi:MAG: ATP-binding protein [Deltaproteobacteria bacterium]|jgi:predicted AAA+ superfamily ATPase|nr:ATP-binding protein [Deltaproteobacteria bacterium]